MNESREQGRATLVIIAIVTLIFINIGMYYTFRITQQSNQITANTDQKTSTAQLDTVNVSKLSDRTHVDVEDKLNPLSSGRDNPFIK